MKFLVMAAAVAVFLLKPASLPDVSVAQAALPTGQALIDEEVLAAAGVTDLEPYRAAEGDGELIADLFVDPAPLR